jgi:hypothetical protein
MRRLAPVVLGVLVLAILAAPVRAAEDPCELTPKYRCFGVESVSASLSTTQAGAHPDLTFSVDVKKDPESETNAAGLKDPYAATRDLRFELPPGLVGDPNVLAGPQQCTIAEFFSWEELGGGCPNGSQIGISKIALNEGGFTEPIYMMAPPGADVVARVGVIGLIYPIFIDFKVRSEGDYGLTAEVVDASPEARISRVETTTWGIPSDPSHNTERCTPREVEHSNCLVSEARPPGSRQLPFMTNPTRCSVPLEMRVAASSWAEPNRFDAKSGSFPEITGCNSLPFGPSIEVKPTSHRAASPTGLDVTLKLPASKGAEVLEPSQTRYIHIDLPQGMAINPSSGEGLGTCSAEQAGFEKPEASHCPDAAKLADAEFEIPVLERRLKGAVYLREPEPEDPFRIWIVADDLGLHVKLPGDLEVDKTTGQIHSIVVGIPKLEGLPQAPLREATLKFKAGARAALVNPQGCGEYRTTYEFVPWSGGPSAKGSTPMEIDEGCGTGGFAPKLTAGSVDAGAGKHSPFFFALTREDGEQNPATFDLSPPLGFAATFARIPRCEGMAAQTGACPPGSRIGRVTAAIGAGVTPLWVPRAGKRPTAVYLSGPYRGAPLSIVAVVPKQAGPFDFGDEVVRSAIHVDPETARATAVTDPIPQIIEGIPIGYRTLFVELDRPGFALNPTGCAPGRTDALVTSAQGAVAKASAPFEAVNCARLGFAPNLSIRLKGGTHRGAHPSLSAVLTARPGDANIGGAQVALPSSEFVDNEHFNSVCTRVQFAAHQCPAGSAYGFAVAKTPLFDFPLEGPVYLRSAPGRELPDIVAALSGPASTPIEIDVDGHVDSINGGLRTTFESVPDAPVTEFTLRMGGGQKGLIVNSTNLCASVNRAAVRLTGQNGKRVALHPVVKPSCRRGHKRHRR